MPRTRSCLLSYGCESIFIQVAHGVAGENARKVVIMLYLLQQGCPMLEYEALKLLFKFLQVLKNSKKHWNDNYSWTMVEFMHQEVLKVTMATHYVALNCDEVSIVDNQYWLSMHIIM
jgi:hypothetical protein